MKEAKQVMVEAHPRMCRTHHSGPTLHDCIKSMDYNWPTI